MNKNTFEKKIKHMMWLLFIVTFSFLSLPSKADDAEIDDLLNLPLEDFVYVASKKYQEIEKAPGVVTVIKRSQIERFGARDLQSILMRVTNLYHYGTLFLTDNVSSIRAGTRRSFDNHVLLLLNGRPLRDASGGVNSPIYKGFPVDIIERLEIVRGPGSVLYGSNAMNGVINIITRQPQKGLDEKRVAVKLGSDVTREIEGTQVGDAGGIQYVVSGKLSKSNGWDIKTHNANRFVDGSYPDQNYDGVAVFNVGDVKFNMYSGTRFTNALETSSATHPIMPRGAKKHFFDVGYEHDLSKQFKMQHNLTYNQVITSKDDIELDSQSFLYEAAIQGDITPDLHAIFGGVMEYREGDTSTFKGYSRDLSFYTQMDYKLTGNTLLTLGVQGNKPDLGGLDYSPRMSVNYHKGRLGYKLSYGKAFRAPSIFEEGSVFFGSDDLKPKTMRTFDAQVYYRNDTSRIALTYYYTKDKGTIVLKNLGTFQYANDPATKARGIELEGYKQLSEEYYVEGSLVWQNTENIQNLNGIGVVSSFMGKLGVSYEPYNKDYGVGLYAHYFSNKTPTEDLRSTTIVNPAPSGYWWLTLNADLNLNSYFNVRPGKELSLNLFAENLLDEEVYHPVSSSTLNSAPLRTGRSVLVTLSYEF